MQQKAGYLLLYSIMLPPSNVAQLGHVERR